MRVVSRRVRFGLLLVGAFVTGAHHIRQQTSAASATAALLGSVSDAARALTVFPILVRRSLE